MKIFLLPADANTATFNLIEPASDKKMKIASANGELVFSETAESAFGVGRTNSVAAVRTGPDFCSGIRPPPTTSTAAAAMISPWIVLSGEVIWQGGRKTDSQSQEATGAWVGVTERLDARRDTKLNRFSTERFPQLYGPKGHTTVTRFPLTASL